MRAIPEDVVLDLKDRYGLRYFVETGTFRGDSALWAATHFDHAWTIENWLESYQNVVGKHGIAANITFVLGDSRDRLAEVLVEVPAPALLWLDAHWLGKGRSERVDDCPVMDELRAVHADGRAHVVMIDDAHFFQGDLPEGTDRSIWPGMNDLKAMLPGYFWTTVKDVIVARP